MVDHIVGRQHFADQYYCANHFADARLPRSVEYAAVRPTIPGVRSMYRSKVGVVICSSILSRPSVVIACDSGPSNWQADTTPAIVRNVLA